MDTSKIIVDGLKNGESKMVILTSLIRADSKLDLTTAGSLFKEVAEKNKLILTNDEKAVLTESVAKKFTDKELNFDREKATKELAEKGLMSPSAASSRLKGYCEEHDIAFPKINTIYRRIRVKFLLENCIDCLTGYIACLVRG